MTIANTTLTPYSKNGAYSYGNFYRGSKKDFMDYAELLTHFSRDKMFSFYSEKYTNSNLWYVEKSLSYFEDADIEPTPRILNGQSWDSIKKTILASNSI